MPALPLACIAVVASLNGLPPRALAAIAAVEGGRTGQVVVNRDGSEDLGPMQVNSRWLPAIAAAIHGSIGQARARLLDDSCFNVSAGGAILRTYMAETPGDLLRAVGNYHSHTPVHHQAYVELVMRAARRLFAAGTAPRTISFTPVP